MTKKKSRWTGTKKSFILSFGQSQHPNWIVSKAKDYGLSFSADYVRTIRSLEKKRKRSKAASRPSQPADVQQTKEVTKEVVAQEVLAQELPSQAEIERQTMLAYEAALKSSAALIGLPQAIRLLEDENRMARKTISAVQ